ncbi:membrane protein [Aliivibrio wodanis]|uniref:Membrane protein n=1 Tax=Aliivibrio wodanis TaxID=80852 RepID=A0A090I6Z3_9GAMM|nr:membrane protein [Aliivibrio wodanis]
MIDDIPAFLGGISSWLINEGIWFFPLALLATNFAFKCFVNNKPDKIDFCQCVVALPAEIKVIACSFVFAASVSPKAKPVETFGLQVVAIVFLLCLGISIGFFNYCKAGKATKIEGSVFWYVIVSLLVAYLMLDTSIDFMKYTVS